MAYVKVHMATKIAVALGPGNIYYSMRSGDIMSTDFLFNKEGTMRRNYYLVGDRTYEQIQASADKHQGRLKKKAVDSSSDNYRDRVKRYTGKVAQGFVPMLPKVTRQGNPFKRGNLGVGVGSSKDSSLVALNNTIARVAGVPLTKNNREIIMDIYGDEIRAASQIANEDFNKRYNQFEKSRFPFEPSLYNPPETVFGKYKMSEKAKKAWTERTMRGGARREREYEALKNLEIPGNPWAEDDVVRRYYMAGYKPMKAASPSRFGRKKKSSSPSFSSLRQASPSRFGTAADVVRSGISRSRSRVRSVSRAPTGRRLPEIVMGFPEGYSSILS